MYRNLFTRDVFVQLNRLHHEAQQAFDLAPKFVTSSRGLTRGEFLAIKYPAINISSSPSAVDIYCFAPGVDPSSIDVQLEKGVLTIAGERKPDTTSSDDKASVRINERFAGRFRRVVTLPDDVDGSAILAQHRDGVLHISAPRREAEQPRRITIQ